MKIHRFFVKHKLEDLPEIYITDLDIIHQIKDVLRLKKGDSVCLFDGSGIEYFGKVKIIMKKESIISKEKIKSFSNNSKICLPVGMVKIKLSPSLIKKDKLEWVYQKATEIGVFSLNPIISERTEKQKINKERLGKIVKEASEQSGKIFIPEINEPQGLEDFLKENRENIYALDLCETKIDVSQMKGFDEVTILIGPEGGWGEKDLENFEKYNVKRISLGEQILRAETASIAASSLLLLG
jgi:16S rRNA (uracil1498-N3)-methyltransferase